MQLGLLYKLELFQPLPKIALKIFLIMPPTDLDSIDSGTEDFAAAAWCCGF